MERWFMWILILNIVTSQDPVANLPQGRIVGIKTYKENSVTPIEIFYGIPYATPPVGRYRFSAPERHTGWRRTFFAHRMPPHCPHSTDGNDDHFSEDCLFLNIWTPRSANGKPLPVLVILYSESWLHGGINLPCQDLAAEGVVVVTVSYRLHTLAFFTLRTISARGNLALLDQYLSFLWIRDNIAAFGGDPAAITLLGHSAGADSILHHIASPRSTGLFQRAIIMSPNDIWKTIDEKRNLNATEIEQVSRSIAHSLGCSEESEKGILDCMRSRPLSDIVKSFTNINWSKAMQPVTDNFLPVPEQYLPNSLPVALSATKQATMQLDILFGTTSLEDFNYNDKTYEDLMKHGTLFITEYTNDKVIPYVLQMFALFPPETLRAITDAIKWEYRGWDMKNKTNRSPLNAIEVMARVKSSAIWGAGGALMAAKLARRVTRLYVYRYVHPGGVDIHGRQFNFTGAVHGSDIVALLGDALMLQVARRPATIDEKRISLLFRQYITNFIKFGSPEEDQIWRRYRAGDAQIYDICDDSIPNLCPDKSSRDTAFWLEYLPQISKLLTSSEHSEHLTLENGEYRLRGGIFAMCGISILLLLLLTACAILLHRQRLYRSTTITNLHN